MTWQPDNKSISRSNIGAALREQGCQDYDELYQWSIADPEVFWGYVVQRLGVRFAEPPTRIVDLSRGPADPEWLPGGKMNIAESCFQADPNAPAIVHGGAGGSLETISYEDLRRIANRVACSLRDHGFQRGDSVAVFMPMTARSVPLYLGIILAGCVVVSIADSFSANELQTRLRIGDARLVFTVAAVDRGGKKIPVFNRVGAAGGPPAVVVDDRLGDGQSLRDGDLLWSDWLGEDESEFVEHVAADAPANILFSSGTTGEPKAIPWDHSTPIKAAADGYFHHDIQPGNVVAWPTNLGWMMGPWLVFATLMNRGTIALYEGSPLERGFGQFIQSAGVQMLGVVPSLVRHWRQSACMEQLDWTAIRAFSSTGECSNADDMQYLSQLAGGRPIIEYCGGTEIGGGYITSTVAQRNESGQFSTPAMGSRMIILDDDGQPSDSGELFLIPPAMGLSRRLLNRDHHEVYYDGTPAGPGGEVLRRHGDEFERLPNGYYRAQGRADDTMNLGGIKVGAAEIERVVGGLGGTDEVAAIAVAPSGGGPSQLVICVGTTSDKAVDPQQLQVEMQRAIKTRLNPLFKIHDIYMQEQLPRTASNKVIRRELRKTYEASIEKL